MGRIFLNICDVAVGHENDILECSPLGTCVAVLLHDAKKRVGAMAHCFLPIANGASSSVQQPYDCIVADEPPGKFVDRAIEYMLHQLHNQGVQRHALVAKLAGGASVFDFEDPADCVKIGEQNLDQALRALRDERIFIAGQATGGHVGRRVRFHVASGDAHIFCKSGNLII